MSLKGVCAAVLTPLTESLDPDAAKAIAYYRRLLDGGCDALNVLGTSGEAMSLSVHQRLRFMHALVEGGLPVARMMVGTGSAALADAIDLTKAALEGDFAAALVMPPFYYRNASDDGVLSYFDRLISGAFPRPGSIYLYNFPQVSGITFTPSLIGRLMGAFPGVFGGLKDSSNDIALMRTVASVHPDLAIFPSSEEHLLFARDNHLAGCISGTVALWPRLAAHVWRGNRHIALQAQERLTVRRNAVAPASLISVVRLMTSLQEEDGDWTRTLPPLAPVARNACGELESYLLADAETCKAMT